MTIRIGKHGYIDFTLRDIYLIQFNATVEVLFVGIIVEHRTLTKLEIVFHCDALCNVIPECHTIIMDYSKTGVPNSAVTKLCCSFIFAWLFVISVSYNIHAGQCSQAHFHRNCRAISLIVRVNQYPLQILTWIPIWTFNFILTIISFSCKSFKKWLQNANIFNKLSKISPIIFKWLHFMLSRPQNQWSITMQQAHLINNNSCLINTGPTSRYLAVMLGWSHHNA